MHPCAEYVIIENNIDVLFIVEMATMESTFLYSFVRALAPPLGELLSVSEAERARVLKQGALACSLRHCWRKAPFCHLW